jgi:hypothetical protein
VLVFIPVALLVLTLLALAGSNLQRGFRSNWLLALGGVSIALLSLLVLRFQLPLESGIAAWWAGDHIQYSATFVLDDRSWPLALMVCGLLVAALLGQVRDAISARWLSWAPGLVAAIASLLAALSGDLLTFAFTLAMLDIFIFVLLLNQLPTAAERQAALNFAGLSALCFILLMMAWSLSFYGSQLVGILVFLAGSFRFGLWTPRLSLETRLTLRRDVSTLLRLAPMAALFALVSHSSAITSSLPHSLALGFLVVPTIYIAARWFSGEDDDSSFELGFAALAVAASVSGAFYSALAFGLVALAGRAMLELAQRADRWRPIATMIGLILLAGFPFTAAQVSAAFYADAASPLVYIFLLPQALLLAGWARRGLRPLSSPLPPEPWMRSLEWIGLAIVPIIYLILGLGGLPYFSIEPLSASWWPPAAALALGATLFFAFRTRRLDLQPRARSLITGFFALDWLEIAAARAVHAIAWFFYFGGRLLEGNAGVLWAILLVVLMLSLIAQFAFTG